MTQAVALPTPADSSFLRPVRACLASVLAAKVLRDAHSNMELAGPPTHRPALTLHGLEMLLIAL